MNRCIAVSCALVVLLCIGEAQAQELFATGEALLAPYDLACDVMDTQVAPAMDWLTSGQPAYFTRPIERRIHQIWFGDPARMDDRRAATWRAHAASFGYTYKLWTEADLDELRDTMPAQNLAIVWQLLARGEYFGASDVLRVFLLEHFGGLYADIDIGAPSVSGRPIDIADVVPMTNIVFMTEHRGRDVGNNVALFAANSFMMCSAHHPLMQHLVRGLWANMQAVTEASMVHSNIHVAYYTGPFYVNRSLSGPMTVLPITFLEQLDMVFD